jgi:hypothetical protein
VGHSGTQLLGRSWDERLLRGKSARAQPGGGSARLGSQVTRPRFGAHRKFGCRLSIKCEGGHRDSQRQTADLDSAALGALSLESQAWTNWLHKWPLLTDVITGPVGSTGLAAPWGHPRSAVTRVSRAPHCVLQ